MAKSQKKNMTVMVPTVDQVQRLRISIDTLVNEIDIEQRRCDEMLAEKRRKLDEQRAELTAIIRQATTALNQLAVPVMSDEAATPTANETETPPAPVMVSEMEVAHSVALPVQEHEMTVVQPLISNRAVFWIVVVVFIMVLFFKCDASALKPFPPIVKPEPPLVHVTEQDRILKEVNESSLTYSEKVVEATRRLVTELDMDMDSAFALAVERIKKGGEPEAFGISDHDKTIVTPSVASFVEIGVTGGVSADTPPVSNSRDSPNEPFVFAENLTAYGRWLQNRTSFSTSSDVVTPVEQPPSDSVVEHHTKDVPTTEHSTQTPATLRQVFPRYFNRSRR